MDQQWGYCSQIKCFRLIDELETFTDARKICQSDDAHLASVHNELEQCKAYSIFNKFSW